MKVLTALLVLASVAGLSLRSEAQITVGDSLSNSAIVQLLEGTNVTISNLQVNCLGAAMGHFSGPSELGINEGLILTTGYVRDAAGPASWLASAGWYTPGDADLEVEVGDITYDACAMEFDCIPAGDTLLFNFSFGSDEYPSFVGDYNDLMAIYISGPDIQFPVNLALLPDGMPVSINNVNSVTNADIFHDNRADSGQYLSYNGFMDKLTGIRAVVPGASYHFKVVIADALDPNFDSALFLEASTFRSVGLVTGMRGPLGSMLEISQHGSMITVALPQVIGASELLVYDAMGRTIKQVAITGREVVFEASALPPAAYTVLLRNGLEVLPARFVKE